MYVFHCDIIMLNQWSLSGNHANAPLPVKKLEQCICTERSRSVLKCQSPHFRLNLKHSTDSIKHRFAPHQSATQGHDSSHLATLKDVEHWLTQLYVEKNSYPLTGIPLLEFQSRFERETRLHLDPAALGESTFRQVLKRFTHLVRVKTINIPGQAANYSNVLRSKMAMSSKIKEDALLEACKQRGMVTAPPSATSPTSVWWDIENCGIPKGTSATQVSRSIRDFLCHHHGDGPVTIQAFGYMPLLPSEVQQGLQAAGILLHSVPAVCKDAGDKALLEGLLTWALAHPPPARMMVISGDHYFFNALTTLQSLGYCIVMVNPLNAARKLREVSTLTVDWSALATGAESSALPQVMQSPLSQQEAGAGRIDVDGIHVGVSVESSRALELEQLNPSQRVREPKQVATLDTLRDWLATRVPQFLSPEEGVAIDDYKFLFETEMQQKVDPTALGFKSLCRLFGQFPELVRVEKGPGQARLKVDAKSGRYTLKAMDGSNYNSLREMSTTFSRTRGDTLSLEIGTQHDNLKAVADLEILLRHLLEEAGINVCPVSIVKERFSCKYGYPLDHHGLGHRTLVSLLQALPKIVSLKPCKLHFTRPIQGGKCTKKVGEYKDTKSLFRQFG